MTITARGMMAAMVWTFGLAGCVTAEDAELLEEGGHDHEACGGETPDCAVETTALASERHAGPPEDHIEFSRRTSDLMANTVFAALIQEIDETTPDNADEGSLSIGLIFNDANRDMRLVGTIDPLRDNDRPSGAFERGALARALTGLETTTVQRVSGRWYYRRSLPLSNFREQCAMCHAAFEGLPATAWVGALMLRVPIAD
jgi:hypothetical protein